MSIAEDLKKIVKKKYGSIVSKPDENKCCCSCDCVEEVNYSITQDDYKNLDGYVADADYGLGCGLPTEYAGIKEGYTVIDLGSGAGNDAFVSRSIVGDSGMVIGIDFTQEMINKANENNSKLGYENVEFRIGDIEQMPVEDNTADVMISNCVLNLVPDKKKAFAEMYRILKPGAHFCVSDIVLNGELPEGIKKSAEMFAGCVSGAVQQDEYLDIIGKAGFKNVLIKKSSNINLPDSILKEYLSENEIKEFSNSNIGISSITVVGYKE